MQSHSPGPGKMESGPGAGAFNGHALSGSGFASGPGIGGFGSGGGAGDGPIGGMPGGGGNGDGIGGGSFGGDGGSTGAGGGSGGAPSDAEGAERARKANPLVDLIDTEDAYVSELGMIIKVRRFAYSGPGSDIIECEADAQPFPLPAEQKVASAWSKSNFPPAELDTMFRNVESVYRVNRTFLKALKEIGPNPSSPKALGDLLMKWIDDLDAPYARYCDNFFSHFDSWPAVQNNAKLGVLLAEISSPPADGSAAVFSDKRRIQEDGWTLDGLFALPQIRLKYYKKLYARLLKSTQPGRSDHKLLVGANDKLDELLDKAKQRIAVSILDEPIPIRSAESVSAGSTSNARESTTSSMGASNSVGGSGDRSSSATSRSLGKESFSGKEAITAQSPVKLERPMERPAREPFRPHLDLAAPGASGAGSSAASSRAPSPLSPHVLSPGSPPKLMDGFRSPSPFGAPLGSNSPLPSPLLAAASASVLAAPDSGSPETPYQMGQRLQAQLDTSRTLDIFSMTPKACQLQICRTDLPFVRELRREADVVMHFTPRTTEKEMTVRRAHIFLLTDLFLVCERMTPSEKAGRSGPGEFWLLFPPLAGKHLRATDMGGQGKFSQEGSSLC